MSIRRSTTTLGFATALVAACGGPSDRNDPITVDATTCDGSSSGADAAPTVDAGPSSDGPSSDADAGGTCDADAYKKAVAACFTGRATGFSLPGAAAHPFNTAANNAGRFAYANQWDYGLPYGQSPAGHGYVGLAINPAGETYDGTHIMPPYNWGAKGQLCDYTRYVNGATPAYNACVAQVDTDLTDLTKNYFIDDFHFYFLRHGHNCHDAAEDVGTCLLDANAALAAGCEFDARVVVWDSAGANQFTGDIFHSQLLVKMRRPDAMGVDRDHVCLVESQSARKDGVIPSACCSTNVALLTGGTPAQYGAAFPQPACPDNWSPAGPGGMNISPQVYGVGGFRAQRDTGDMDMDNGYDRQKGLAAVQVPGPFAPPPKNPTCTNEGEICGYEVVTRDDRALQAMPIACPCTPEL